MIFVEENSYINEHESISIGNKLLYDLCSRYPMNDFVNSLIAKLWIIGRSYAASPERRNYGKDYAKNNCKDSNGKEIKLNLNTGSNGTDSFFMLLSRKIIEHNEYEILTNKINLLSNLRFAYCYEQDKDLLMESCKVVVLFNKILRECIEKCDEQALMQYENITKKLPSSRDLRYFISISSKFIHFHLPNLVFIIDSFSFAHAKKKETRKKDANYLYIDKDGNTIFAIINSDVHYLSTDECQNEKERNYINHVSRCYAIMCKLKNKYNCDITPRMLDNFIMHVNLDSTDSEIE